jgi:tight adherence protein C
MGVLFLVVGLLLVGVAVALALRAAAMPRIGADRRLGQIGAYGFGAADGEGASGAEPAGGVRRVAERLGGASAARFGLDESGMRRDLMAAGMYSITPAEFIGYRLLGTGFLSLFLLWWTSSHGPLTRVVLLTCIGVVAGWFGPAVYVKHKARLRFEEIERGLPELVDLLVVTVEAGLGLSSSMQLAATRISGPLGDELRLTLQEQRMGLSTTESLSNMLGRCETPSMRSFVRSILQGETLGVSIGNIMRNLAADMRIRRRQSAEQRAQKAPVKILFPLVFFIFPPMFIVLLFPAAYNFMETFGTGP